MAWVSFGALPCRKKKTWWQLASRYFWNHACPWHAFKLVSFLVGLRTYQHPCTISYILTPLRRELSSSFFSPCKARRRRNFTSFWHKIYLVSFLVGLRIYQHPCTISYILTPSRRELSTSFFFLQGKAPKEIHAILTETSSCFLPGRAKDLSALLYHIIHFNNIETRAVIQFFFSFSLPGKAPKEIHAILTETLACFLPGRAKDLSGLMLLGVGTWVVFNYQCHCSTQWDIMWKCR